MEKDIFYRKNILDQLVREIVEQDKRKWQNAEGNQPFLISMVASEPMISQDVSLDLILENVWHMYTINKYRQHSILVN